MPVQERLKRFHEAWCELSQRKQEHLDGVHETSAQHRQAALAFARRFVVLSFRSLRYEIVGTPLDQTPVGGEILTLAQNMAARNPVAAQNALKMGPVKNRCIWKCMMAAALRTTGHAFYAGLWTDGGSRRAIRAAFALGLTVTLPPELAPTNPPEGLVPRPEEAAEIVHEEWAP